VLPIQLLRWWFAKPGGTPLNTHIAETRSEAERTVAREIADLVRAHQSAGKGAVLGLATGGTQLGVYAELVRLHREDGLSFAGVTTFNLDEYSKHGPDDVTSFHAFMARELFDHVDLDPASVHLPNGCVSTEQAQAECEAFERKIKNAGGIDLQLLGIGRNGHIGFNEPGSTRHSRTRLVDLDETTRADAAPHFKDSEVPRQAISMGIATILDARRLRVLAFGASKASIVSQALRGEIGPDIPASFLRGHANVAYWLDRDAAGELEEETSATA
jgi:glucosamine-6-phosphate deaminase